MTIQDLLDLLNGAGTLGALLIAIFAFMTKRVVPGWVYQDVVKREAEWKALALSGTDIGHRSVTLAEQVAKAGGEA